MKTTPISPANIRFDDASHPGQPFAPDFGDGYHARIGAFAQARHVFLGGNGLPQRWRGRARFVILETGFGLGNNFLATWEAWQQDPLAPAQLVYLAIEKHPPRLADLAFAHRQGPCPCPAPALADALLAQWPPATHDLHRLEFEQGRVQLLLAFGDVATWLPELVAEVDAFYLDGFSPACNADMWDPRLLRQLARLGSVDTTAATWSVARQVRDGLGAAGFLVERRPGFGTKRDMISARRRLAPADPVQSPTAARALRHGPPPGRQAAPRHQTALVIGAGLAGASAARALAAQGVAVTVLERQNHAAAETSGNLAGLFHGVFHPQDGAHAQLLRAAALRAERSYAPLLRDVQPLPGRCDGLLRSASRTELASMQADILRQQMPSCYVAAVDAAEASELAGLALAEPAWYYPGGGWLSPPALVARWLAGSGILVRTGCPVSALQQQADRSWQARDEAGRLIAEADLVVVAGAGDGLKLLQAWTDLDLLALRHSRGQVTRLTEEQATEGRWPRARLPLASGHYTIQLPDSLGGGLLCGASNQPDDTDPTLRASDHANNLRGLLQWGSAEGAADAEPARATSRIHDASWLDSLQGRVGWRLACDDRLPLVGPVPLPREQLTGHRRLEQPRQVPRQTGLYLLSALGSRGITLAPLLGDVLAAWITGAPQPVGSSLLDAIDPARFVARRVRQPQRSG